MSGSVSVTAITSTSSSSSLDVGSTVTFALSASAAIQVTPASGGGQPALTLNNGGLASYTSTDANGNLLFSYTVAAGESTPDLKVTGLNLNGATITSVGDIAFSAPTSYAAGQGPYANAVADLNGDGKPDLVVANYIGNTVSVLLGDGQGGFAPQVIHAVGPDPEAVVIDDVNADGKLDLLTANGNDGTVSVLLGDGQGGFAPQVTYTAAPHRYTAYTMAVADLNGDGKPDIVTANNTDNTVSVLLGDGQGGFGSPASDAVGLAAYGVAVSDLNGDGKPDIVAANYTSGTVSVLLGDGQGGFAPQVTYAVGSGPGSVAVADLNGDNKPDIVAANYTSGTVSVLLSDGRGGFAPQVTYAVGSGPGSVAVADLNGDGKPDIATGNGGDGTASVLLGDGRGGFAAQTTYAAGSGSNFTSTADLNGDGKPDLVASNDPGATVSVLLNNSVAPGQTLDASGLAALSGADTGDSVACYRRGTRLATPDGEAAVEDLRIGDLVATPDGPVPVRWIGRRSYSGRFARGNKAVLPVRIGAGALADGVPGRDLWVSPKHALLLDGLLIPAEVLVNGSTVVQEREVDSVEYFHVELDRHGILVAEGALAESFVDDNSRGMFHNAHEHATLHPGAPRVPALYCAPRREDGEQVEAVRRRLARRADPAAPLGHEGFGALRGSVDLVEGGRVYGWAQHAERPEVPVCLEVLLGGTVVAQVLANRHRPDLWQAGLGSGCHAFEAALPEALRTHAHAHDMQTLRVCRIADGAELPKLSCVVPDSAWERDPERDRAA